jgi:adenylate cyclase
MPMAPPVEALSRALDDERARGARLVNRWRLVGMSIVLVINTIFLLWRSPYIGPGLELAGAWWALALVVVLLARRSDRWARATALAIPLGDMPLCFLLQLDLVRNLQGAGFPADAPVNAALTGGLFAVLIFLATGLLGRGQVLLVTAIAVCLQMVLAVVAQLDVTVATFSVFTLVFAGVLSVVASGRVFALVESTVREQRRRERLGRYFSPGVVELLEKREAGGEGETAEVTLLFADLRDFTLLTADRSAVEVVRQLNDFHEAMVAVLFAHGGTLDKYLGDGVMAYFGAPVAQADHAVRAVRCALAMQDALAALNRVRQAAGSPPLRLGVGIHTGSVVVGDIGARLRREYTAIGHAVNVASHIEQQTKALGVPILVSEESRRAIGDALALRSAGEVEVKGASGPVRLFAPGVTGDP